MLIFKALFDCESAVFQPLTVNYMYVSPFDPEECLAAPPLASVPDLTNTSADRF